MAAPNFFQGHIQLISNLSVASARRWGEAKHSVCQIRFIYSIVIEGKKQLVISSTILSLKISFTPTSCWSRISRHWCILQAKHWNSIPVLAKHKKLTNSFEWNERESQPLFRFSQFYTKPEIDLSSLQIHFYLWLNDVSKKLWATQHRCLKFAGL